ncbi:hypothetical protein C5C11_03775 [Rathayibacter rathayi]|nr:hypothetical protein C5C11_03775 [Rathayibacter rathayi]
MSRGYWGRRARWLDDRGREGGAVGLVDEIIVADAAPYGLTVQDSIDASLHTEEELPILAGIRHLRFAAVGRH